tara:strand:- start:910 stop:1302 length:393 start_codon:yes stop_codon:yes gene_type:complete
MAFKMKGFPMQGTKSTFKQKLDEDGNSIFSPKESDDKKKDVLKPGDKGYVAPAGISKDDKTIYKQYTAAEKAQHVKDNIALDKADEKSQGGKKSRDYEDAYENAQNDHDTSNPTKAQIAAALAKIKKERE